MKEKSIFDCTVTVRIDGGKVICFPNEEAFAEWLAEVIQEVPAESE